MALLGLVLFDRSGGWVVDAGRLDQAAFEMGYVDEDCVRRREPLSACWTLRFERLPPVSRLAKANRISHLALHEHINDRHRVHPAPLPLLDAISHLSGHPRDRLLKALPDLRTSDFVRGLPGACHLLDDGWHVQAVCTLCLAAKGVFTQARHWVPKDTRLCLRHGRWTDTYHTQFDVSLLPEIIQAQRTIGASSGNTAGRPSRSPCVRPPDGAGAGGTAAGSTSRSTAD
ncbi:hypothetical protein ACFVGY_13350 [Streptomyces sp. NPDC127106]|uniref:hypothetical protein n=1 Tax=Streptomyces sp. NPDC127106 TaxID=3345360 RepID=UPI00363AC38C